MKLQNRERNQFKTLKQAVRFCVLTVAMLMLVTTLSACDGHGGNTEKAQYEAKLKAVLKERYNEDFEVTKMEYNWNLKEYNYEVKSKIPPYAGTYGNVSIEEPLATAQFSDTYVQDYIMSQMQQYFSPKLKTLFPKDTYFRILGSVHTSTPEFEAYYRDLFKNFKQHKPQLSEILKEKPEALYMREEIHVYLDMDTVNREEYLKKTYSYFRAHKDLGMKGIDILFQFIDTSAKQLWNPAERYTRPADSLQDFDDVDRDLNSKHVYFTTVAIADRVFDKINTYEEFRKQYINLISAKREEKK